MSWPVKLSEDELHILLHLQQVKLKPAMDKTDFLQIVFLPSQACEYFILIIYQQS